MRSRPSRPDLTRPRPGPASTGLSLDGLVELVAKVSWARHACERFPTGRSTPRPSRRRATHDLREHEGLAGPASLQGKHQADHRRCVGLRAFPAHTSLRRPAAAARLHRRRRRRAIARSHARTGPSNRGAAAPAQVPGPGRNIVAGQISAISPHVILGVVNELGEPSGRPRSRRAGPAPRRTPRQHGDGRYDLGDAGTRRPARTCEAWSARGFASCSAAPTVKPPTSLPAQSPITCGHARRGDSPRRALVAERAHAGAPSCPMSPTSSGRSPSRTALPGPDDSALRLGLGRRGRGAARWRSRRCLRQRRGRTGTHRTRSARWTQALAVAHLRRLATTARVGTVLVAALPPVSSAPGRRRHQHRGRATETTHILSHRRRALWMLAAARPQALLCSAPCRGARELFRCTRRLFLDTRNARHLVPEGNTSVPSRRLLAVIAVTLLAVGSSAGRTSRSALDRDEGRIRNTHVPGPERGENEHHEGASEVPGRQSDRRRRCSRSRWTSPWPAADAARDDRRAPRSTSRSIMIT